MSIERASAAARQRLNERAKGHEHALHAHDRPRHGIRCVIQGNGEQARGDAVESRFRNLANSPGESVTEIANWFIADLQFKAGRLDSAAMLRSASQINLVAASSLGKCAGVLMILRTCAFAPSVALACLKLRSSCEQWPDWAEPHKNRRQTADALPAQ